jgi:hypothetical protein
MPSLEELLNEVDLYEEVLKNNLLIICIKHQNQLKDDMQPYLQHLRQDFPNFVSLWNLLGGGFSGRDFECSIHNLIIEMVNGYKKGNQNLYKVLIKLNNKYAN